MILIAAQASVLTFWWAWDEGLAALDACNDRALVTLDDCLGRDPNLKELSVAVVVAVVLDKGKCHP